MTKVSYGKYQLKPDAPGIHGRFAHAYEESPSKSLLMSQCIAGGAVLRECGLLELVTTIIDESAYSQAKTSLQRRDALLNAISGLIGIKPLPAAQPMELQPLVPETPPTATEGHYQAIAEANPDPQQPTEQPAVQRGIRMRQGATSPNIGAQDD